MSHNTRKLYFFLSCLPAIGLVLFAIMADKYLWGVRASLPIDYYWDTDDRAWSNPAQIAPLKNILWQRVNPHIMLPSRSLENKLWVRIKLPVTNHETRYFGAVNHLFIRGVQFYRQVDDAASLEFLGGTQTSENWAWPYAPSFAVTAKSGQSQTVYARIHTRMIWAIPLIIQEEATFHQYATERRLLYLFICGVAAASVALCSAFYVVLRQRVFFHLAMTSAMLTIALGAFSGHTLAMSTYLAMHHDAHILAINTALLLATMFGLGAFLEHLSEASHKDSYKAGKGLVLASLALLIASPVLPRFAIDICMAGLYIFLAALTFGHIYRTRYKQKIAFLALSAFFITITIVLSIGVWTGYLAQSLYLEVAVFFGTTWMSGIMVIDIALNMIKIQKDRQTIVETLIASQANLTTPQKEKTAHGVSISVTMMHIDIVGFSTAAELQNSEALFAALSSRHLTMMKIIESEHGVIDRTLGDGLLCYFPNGAEHHAIRAWRAASQIQRSILAEAKHSGRKARKLLLPVRIGIHSDQVMIGDLGGGQRIDFTMVGSGISVASQLEQSCSPFKILISKSTHAHLINNSISSAEFSLIRLPNKLNGGLSEAFEMNPCSHLQGASDIIREALSLDGSEPSRDRRYHVEGPTEITLKTERITLKVVEYSASGFKALSSHYLARGVIIEAELDLGLSALNQSLSEKYLDALTVEVKWSREDNNGFAHGLRILGEAPPTANYRFRILETHPSSIKPKPRTA